MEKVVRMVSKVKADDAEVSYWAKKGPGERLAALALLGQTHQVVFPKGVVWRAIRKRSCNCIKE